MNVREEDKQKNNCPSRGLGLAAAAIGVGVGAALYYFFSKRPEHPDGEGSTSGWTCEQPHTFQQLHESDDSYLTISETTTSDTSVHDSDSESSEESDDDSSEDEEESNLSLSSLEMEPDRSSEADVSFENYLLQHYASSDVVNLDSESENMDWDVTTSSVDVPVYEFPQRSRFIMNTSNFIRERSWSLEECSICFDIILKDQQVTTLPCTHHFHSACITPWLQEQQTCPNCRKTAE